MGSKRLSDVVTEIVDGALAGEIVNARQAAVDRWDDIDTDGQYLAGIEGVVARVSSKARSLRVSAAVRHSKAQQELPFRLPAVVAMDTEESVLLPTRGLTRGQFIRAIEIREKQIKDDQSRLREWKRALKAADLFWSKNPDWSFGECLDAIMGKLPA
jgi:hypothetical protein